MLTRFFFKNMNMFFTKTSFLKNCLLRPCTTRLYYSTNHVLERKEHSYVFSPGDQKLIHLTVGGALNRAADLSGDHVAIVSSEQNIRRTFSELRNDVNKLASGLLSLGLCKGDRIALCAPNIYEWPVTFFAAAKAGLILVNLNPAYRENELKYSLSKADCKAVIISNTFKTQDYYSMLCSFLPELSNSKATSLQSKNLPNLRTVILLSDIPKNGTLTYSDVLKAGDSKSDKLLHDIEEHIQFDNPVNLQFTSGTTGNPKGAVLSHHSIINNALLANRRLGSHIEKPIICCPIPLYHTFGCVQGIIGSALYQNIYVLPSAGFDIAAVVASIEKEKCTRMLGAPTMFMELINRCEQTKKSLNSLNQVVLGGASSPEQLFKDIRDKLKITSIFEGYGITETSPGVALNGVLDFSDLLSGYRPVLDFVEVKIVNSEKEVVDRGDEGEICVRGHNVFLGYWNDKEKTDEVIDETKWYKTGDLGRMNEKGWIKVVGRIKDMIIRGGENIYPAEIENFLHSHPSVSEVSVCGVPDPKMGEELCAWIKLKEGEKLTEQDLKSYCKNKISHFKVPKYILFVNEFPKTITGKVQKFRMKDISTKQLGL